ncbi:MAG TPA: pitrilysin family protein [Pyrinomonadaceae bacterium]
MHFAFCICATAQEAPPAPSAPRPVQIPAVKEKKLPNGLTVAVVERKTVPLVTVQLLVKSGAQTEESAKAGLANMTAALLTKGTKTRTATQIAEEMEFLGGSIAAGAGWTSSAVTIGAMSSKIDAAMAIMADVVLNPAFKQEEIDLLKSQTLDGLTYNLKQPGFLANYVSTAYSLYEHPPGGTPESLNGIVRNDFVEFHRNSFEPQNAILIFAGDITAVQANALARKYFGKWKNKPAETIEGDAIMVTEAADSVSERRRKEAEQPLVKRILVIDLPNSGQAAVSFNKSIRMNGRIVRDDKKNKGSTSQVYYPAMVMNSLLGGGYSSRLNQEIRIKRGLSYGAGSSFAWRWYYTNFGTRTQTKNESAAEVAELVLAEIKKLTEGSIADTELNPRKSVLTGNFGRNLETTGGLAAAIADLYIFELSTSELNTYMNSVQSVSDVKIRDFAKQNLMGGDVVIVGDYAVFKDDLAKRFPGMTIEVIKADELDLSKENLRKTGGTPRNGS